MTYPKGTIVRYATASRINHWITAGCFVLLVLSGLSMFHPMLFFLSELFGGGQWTRAAHPWFGVMLFVSYSGLIIQFWRDEMWTRDDLAWVKAIDRVLVNEEEGVLGDGAIGASVVLQRPRHMGNLFFLLFDDRAAADRVVDP